MLRGAGDLPPGMMKLGGPDDASAADPGLGAVKPRFARPGNDDLSAVPADTAAAWGDLAAPYAKAFSVFSRALDAAAGKGEGVTDEEIREAGMTLAAMAQTGSLAFSRPAGSLGAGGKVLTAAQRQEIERLTEAGMSGAEIARRLKISPPAVSNVRRETGQTGRGRQNGDQTPVARLNDGDEIAIARAILSTDLDRMPVTAVAELYGITGGQAMLIAMKREKDLAAGVVASSAAATAAQGQPAETTPTGPTAGMPPEITAAVNALKSRYAKSPEALAKLDDILFSDHVLSGLETWEMSKDEAGRSGIARRLIRDIEKSMQDAKGN